MWWQDSGSPSKKFADDNSGRDFQRSNLPNDISTTKRKRLHKIRESPPAQQALKAPVERQEPAKQNSLQTADAQSPQSAKHNDITAHELQSVFSKENSDLSQRLTNALQVQQITQAELLASKQFHATETHKLQTTIAALQQQCKSQETSHAEQFIEAVAQHTREVAEFKATIVSHQQAAETRESARCNLEASLAALKIALAAQAAEAHQSQNVAKAKLATTEQRHATDIHHLRTKIAALEQQCKSHKANYVDRLSRAVEKYNCEVADFKANIAILEQTAEVRESNRLELETSHTELKASFTAQILEAYQSLQVAEDKLETSEQRHTTEIRQLRSTIVALERRCESNEARYVEKLTQAADQHTSEIAELNVTIANQAQEMEARESARIEVEACIAALKISIADQTAESNQALQVAADKLETSEQLHATDIQQLRNTIAALEQQRELKEASYVEQLAQAADRHTRDVVELNVTIANQAQEMEARESARIEVEACIAALKISIADQTAESNKALQVAADKLETSEQLHVTDIQQLRNTIAALELRCKLNQASYAEQLTQAVDQHTSEVAELNVTIANQAQELKARESARIEVEAYIAALKISIADKTAESNKALQVAADKLETSEQLHATDIQQLRNTIAALELRCKLNQASYAEQLTQAVDQHTSEVAELNVTIANQAQELKARESARIEVEAYIAALKISIADQTAKLNKALQVAADKLETSEQLHATDIQQLRNTIAELELRRELNEASYAEQLTQAVDQHTSEVAELNVTIANQEQELADRESARIEVEASIAALKISIADQTAESNQALQVAADKLETSEQLYAADIQQLRNTIAALEQQRELNEASYAEQLTQAVDQHTSEVAELNVTIANQEQELEARESARIEVEAYIAALKISIADKTAESNKALQVAADKLETSEQLYATDIQQLRNTIAALEQQRELKEARYVEQLAQADDRHTGDVAELKATIASLKQDLDGAMEAVNGLRSTQTELLRELCAQRDRISVAHNSHSDAEHRLRELQCRHVSESDALRKVIGELEQTRIDSMQTQQTQQASFDQRVAEYARQLDDAEQAARSAKIETLQSSQLICHYRDEAEQAREQMKSLQAGQQQHESLLAEIFQLKQALEDRCTDERAACVPIVSNAVERGPSISKWREHSAELQRRLQHESAGRRKAESALKRASEIADDRSVACTAQVQIEAEQRAERLMRELDSTRLLGLSMKQHAIKKIKQGQAEIKRLKCELAGVRLLLNSLNVPSRDTGAGPRRQAS